MEQRIICFTSNDQKQKYGEKSLCIKGLFIGECWLTATKTSLKKWIRAASNFTWLIPSHLIRQIMAKGKEKENCCLVFTSYIKREIRKVHVVSRATTANKVTKKHNACAKLLFCQSKPIATSFPGFCQRELGNEVEPIAFFLPLPFLLLKLPILLLCRDRSRAPGQPGRDE